MKNRMALVLTLSWLASLAATSVQAQDWPQWRGPNRDAKAADFKAPKTWPKELTQKWKVTVGEGVATPALVGDRLYVFSREGGSEVARCLNAADGKELWQDKYDSLGATGGAAAHSGPRSSPAVANGKVVTLGVRGMISCLDAATGKKLWRKDDFHDWPMFHPASSPVIVDGVCIAQLGGRTNGALVAYDLATGDEKWKWNGPSPAHGSPVLLKVGGATLVVAQTESKLVAVNAADGKLAWESAASPGERGGGGRGGGPGGPGGPGGTGGPGGPGGRGGPGGGRGGGMGGRDYRAATPIVDGQTIITAGQGLKAMRIEKEGDKFVAKEVWSNTNKSVQFNTPVLKNGLLYGLAPNNDLFCVNAKDGQTLWTAPFPGGAPAPAAASGAGQDADRRPDGDRPPGGGPGGPGGGRGRGFGGGSGYGSIVDAGSVLLAMTPSAQLVVFEPGGKEFKQLASYKVAPTPTHSYPVASGNRIFIKDKDSVTLWTID